MDRASGLIALALYTALAWLQWQRPPAPLPSAEVVIAWPSDGCAAAKPPFVDFEQMGCGVTTLIRPSAQTYGV
jgi:hypothetical protein